MKNDSKNTILIIEDEVPVRMSITAYLEDHGYTVLEAENGRVGIEVFRREAPDLILVDLRMPEVDGLEVLAGVTAESPETPIIVVSGTGLIGDAVEALRLGAWDYLLKPISDMEVLLHVVQNAMEKSKLIIENRMYQEHLEQLVKERTAELEKEIQERRQTEVTLKESEERYRTLINTAREGVWMIDLEMRTTFVNRQMATMLGYSAEEMIGRTIPEFLDDENAGIFRQRFKKRKEGKHEQYDIKFCRKDGTEMWGIVNGSPLFGIEGEVVGAFAMVTDVTERKQAEEALKVSERNYREIFNGTNDSIIVYDMTTGAILDVNQKASEMLGYEPEKLKELSVKDISQGEPPYSEQEALQWIRKAVEEGPQCLEWLLKKKNGDLLWVEVNLKQTTISGHDRLLAVARDITYRKRVQEEQLKHLSFLEKMEQINQAIRSATDVEEMMGDVLDTILSIFNCDRAWLLYPCDPDARFWHVPMERTKPEYTGVHASGEKFMMNSDMAEYFRRLLNSEDPYTYMEPPGVRGRDLQDKYGVRSVITMAIYPKVGKAWNFGLHQCSHERVWSEDEQRLFKEIGNRITDALSNLLFLRDLQESEELYRNLFETSLVGLWRTRIEDSKFIRSNIKHANMVGVETADELIKNYSASEFYSPERRAELIELLKKDGEVSDFEVRLILKNGKEKDISISAKMFPEKGYIEGAMIDITDRKKAEEALKESEQRFRYFLDNLGDVAYEADSNGNVTYANRMAEEITGMLLEEIIGKPFLPLFTKESQKTAVEVYQRTLNGESPEYELTLNNGRICHFKNEPLRDKNQNIIGVFGTARDITERKRAEKALRKSEERLSLVIEGTNDGFWDWNVATGQAYFSPRYYTMLGYAPDEFPASYESWRSLIHPEDIAATEETLRRHFEKKLPIYTAELRLRTRNGDYRWILTRGKVVERDVEGNVVRLAGTHSDITDRKQAEEALRRSEERLSVALEGTMDGIWDWNPQNREGYFSPRCYTMLGYEPNEYPSTFEANMQMMHPDDVKKIDKVARKAIEEHSHFASEFRLKAKDGSWRWILSRGKVVEWDASGKAIRMAGSRTDITERKQAEAKIRESEERYRLLFDTTEVLVSVYNREGICQLMNKRVAALFGGEPEDFIGKSIIELHPKDGRDYLRSFHEALDGGIAHQREDQVAFPQGSRWLLTQLQPIPDAQGVFRSVQIISQDLTERKQAEEALKESEKRYRVVVEDMPAMICRFLPDGTLTFVNSSYSGFFDSKPEELVGQNFFQFIPEAERNMVQNHFIALDQNMPMTIYEHQVITPDGSTRWQEWTDRALFNEKGQVVEYQSIGRDITEVKLAQEEKSRIEHQLQQAQKMEAIGTLAGGIAHDFNNILGAIIGYAGMMEMFDVPEDSHLKAKIKEVLKAANRAKDLVQQILTFSRQTEQERKPVQLNYIVKEALKFLRASLPTTIEIHRNIDNQELIALADPTQMHQILMNLCTNAAHAMRETGGRLEVTLSALDLDDRSAGGFPELNPGSYLQLTVSDTGHGMAPEVVERIFDPFFTTKKPGEGTGMGLAVVHGIVKSHEGVIVVNSELGQGTVFQMILPRIEMGTIEPGKEAEPSMATGTERILFIDDEKYLAALAQEMLGRLGYIVTVKTSSREALELFRLRPENFDLVITDQTMPHMTGLELAREILQIRSDIPVILCTGYSEVATPERVEATGIRELINKPLQPSGLAQTIRKILDNKLNDL